MDKIDVLGIMDSCAEDVYTALSDPEGKATILAARAAVAELLQADFAYDASKALLLKSYASEDCNDEALAKRAYERAVDARRAALARLAP